MNQAVTNASTVFHLCNAELYAERGGKHCEYIVGALEGSAHFKAFAVGLAD